MPPPTATLSALTPPHRIALLKPSALGDIVHALPVLSALRQMYPAAEITWIVNRLYEPLLQGHPDLDRTIGFDRGMAKAGWWQATTGFLRFLKQLRRERFDWVIDLQGLLRTGIMTWASGAKQTIGLANAREGATWCYRHRLTVPTAEMHAVDRYWLVIEALGWGDLPKRFLLPRQPLAEEWAVRQLLPWPKPWVMLNLGTRWETKRWPVAHFAALAQEAQTVYGATPILVGGPDETRLGEEFQHLCSGKVLNLIGQSSLPQLVSLLARADLMISNDSGPLHLADALGRPVIAPYTCTSIRRTGPYNQVQGAVATQVWCAASYLKKCPRMECMTELTPARLLPLLHRNLAPWQTRSA
jgi:lipopolysaccharide heptosyltransferase I